MIIETQTVGVERNSSAFEEALEAFNAKSVSVVKAAVAEKEGKAVQLAAFLANEIVNPGCTYPHQEKVTDEGFEAYTAEAAGLLARADIPEGLRAVYEGFIDVRVKRMELILAMRHYNETKSPEAADSFMAANIELYGAPDEVTYRSLLGDKVASLSAKTMSPEAKHVYGELLALLPQETQQQSMERFQPERETIEWVKSVAEALYGDMLRHVPEGDVTIDTLALRDIFDEIIMQEFGDAASEWSVVIEEASAINVNAKTKKVTIPIHRASMHPMEARRLVVHELGIHLLRAVTGGSTDIMPLRSGLGDYAEAEEGLGKVMEQAVAGRFEEAGTDHYITAGLAYFDKKSFRGAFEIKWRMQLLEMIEEGAVPSGDQVQLARRLAADGPRIATTRIFRGTDDLPLFKDLAYYNGSIEVWKYLERIRGDDLRLSLLLAGKVNTSTAHQRVVLESSTIE